MANVQQTQLIEIDLNQYNLYLEWLKNQNPLNPPLDPTPTENTKEIPKPENSSENNSDENKHVREVVDVETKKESTRTDGPFLKKRKRESTQGTKSSKKAKKSDIPAQSPQNSVSKKNGKGKKLVMIETPPASPTKTPVNEDTQVKKQKLDIFWKKVLSSTKEVKQEQKENLEEVISGPLVKINKTTFEKMLKSQSCEEDVLSQFKAKKSLIKNPSKKLERIKKREEIYKVTLAELKLNQETSQIQDLLLNYPQKFIDLNTSSKAYNAILRPISGLSARRPFTILPSIHYDSSDEESDAQSDLEVAEEQDQYDLKDGFIDADDNDSDFKILDNSRVKSFIPTYYGVNYDVTTLDPANALVAQKLTAIPLTDLTLLKLNQPLPSTQTKPSKLPDSTSTNPSKT